MVKPALSSATLEYLAIHAAILLVLQLLVLRYVQNKDVFMRYHKAHLTRRLILDSSADSEKEENMVEWLRVRTGAFFLPTAPFCAS